MRTILVTGFEPFGSLRRNPSQAVLEALPATLTTGATLIKKLLPVHRLDGPASALAAATPEVDAVLGLGVAVGATVVQLERVFINLCVDDDGSGPLEAGGPDGLFASIPLVPLVVAASETGVPAGISNTAGTYICNALGYQLRHHLPDLPSGFVHLPMTPGYDVTPGTPTLTFAQELTAVTAILCALDRWLG